ncbi:hypothetical protein CHS0354_021460 [Potamilus streckersoni]|uniref:Uncharacterized protein n=1 Tax=Potamilus streckersoni TaxID=2493646 RepID=A0AAE0S1S1_9BIVA|nr:hypothetical protein CHS0354_021460 [Potamilus streckersoni]
MSSEDTEHIDRTCSSRMADGLEMLSAESSSGSRPFQKKVWFGSLPRVVNIFEVFRNSYAHDKRINGKPIGWARTSIFGCFGINAMIPLTSDVTAVAVEEMSLYHIFESEKRNKTIN